MWTKQEISMNVGNLHSMNGGSRRLYSYVSGSDDEVEVINDSKAVPIPTTNNISGSGGNKMFGGRVIRPTFGDSSLQWIAPPPPKNVPPPAEPDNDDRDEYEDASDASSPSWVRSDSEEDESDGRGRRHHGRSSGVRNFVGRPEQVDGRIRRNHDERHGNGYSNVNATLPIPPPLSADEHAMNGGGAAPLVPPRRQPSQFHQQHSLGGAAAAATTQIVGNGTRMYASGAQTCDRLRSINNNKNNGDPSTDGGDRLTQYHQHHQHQRQDATAHNEMTSSSRVETTSFIGQSSAPGRQPVVGTVAPVASGVAPTFPRTVPRIGTLGRTNRSSVNDHLESQHLPSQHYQQQQPQSALNQSQQTMSVVSTDVTDSGTSLVVSQRLQPGSGVPGSGSQTSAVPLWRRKDQDGIPTGYCGPERLSNANLMLLSMSTANHNNSSMMSSQPRFHSAGRRMRKHLESRSTWKCLSIVLTCVIVALIAIVSYLIAMKVHNLTWRLEQTSSQAYQLSSLSDDPEILDGLPATPVGFETPISTDLAPHTFWPLHFYLPEASFVKLTVTPPATSGAIIGLYGRRNVPPTHTRHDFFHAVDADNVALTRVGLDRRRSVTAAASYGNVTSSPIGSATVQYLDSGVWYVFMYNDDDRTNHVTFVATIQDQSGSSCAKACHGRGDCVNGQCRCFPGFTGWECQQSVCPTLCQGNGVYSGGECKCYPGWKGRQCEIPVSHCDDPTCGGNGKCVHGYCVCAPGYRGTNCDEQLCSVECKHGRCERQRCVCDDGWSGAACNQVNCDPRCAVHGTCVNGSCHCKPGWNGRHCALDGCRNSCNSHGVCEVFFDTWRCSCQPEWKGTNCEVAKEIDCDNELDDDKDGLIDCIDPDCCISAPCKDNTHCQSAPDPMEILLRKQPPSSSAPFYERMRFLIEDDSLQNYVTLTSFNQSQVSVIRGKVVQTDGTPLIGVRVGIATQPLYGFTLSRDSGIFDILVNGGGSMTLTFQRHPFKVKQTTLMVPWNRLVMLDVVTMVLEGEQEPVIETCPHVEHDHYVMRPVVLSTWQHTQLGSCPEQSTVIPESQVLQESLPIPGTNIYLIYRSSQTSGYMSTIAIQLTQDRVPGDLVVVHLRIVVEGLVFKYVFEAEKNLRYRFTWDRRNAYNQKVYGIVSASVGVGYEYQGCSRVFWETQSTTMNSFDITPSEIGGWNLNLHHTYNFQEGILHKGDGTNVYLKERPRRVATTLGDGKSRRVDCRGCDGRVEDARLLAPVALASGRDGSLYVGDFNFVRKLAASRDEIASIMQLSATEMPYKYFLTVSPLDGKLYISDYQTRRILRVKTMGPVRDLAQNYEVVAGTGEQCIPGDKDQCGDNGPATAARLFYPKGIAIDKDGIIYFADGANIRTITENGTILTLIGSQGHAQYFEPLPCYKVVTTKETMLHWPLSLTIDPIDNTLNIVDNNVVLKVTADNKVIVVAGRLLHCPPRNPDAGLLNSDPDASVELETNSAGPAADSVLESPQHIAFSTDGVLYVVESNGRTVNRVRMVGTDGMIRFYAGSRRTSCECRSTASSGGGGQPGSASGATTPGGCQCFDAGEQLATRMLLDTPTSVTVTPDGVVHVADMGNLRVHSILAPTPSADRNGGYEVLYPQTSEMYVFNRFGHHIATRDIVTGQTKYNFTYSVNSYYGRLMKVTDSAGSLLTISRDYKMAAKELVTPGGLRCLIAMDSMGQLASFVGVDNLTSSFNYLGNSGLIESKQNSLGETFLYEYDNYGRLTYVIQPTGDRVSIDAETGFGSLSSSDVRVSFPHDSYLAIEYPFKMAVTIETIPHPLLSTDRPLSVRRRIILPDDQTHVAEWRYYGRGNDVRTGSTRRNEAERGTRASGKHSASGPTGGATSAGGSRALSLVDTQEIAAGFEESAQRWGYKGKELMVNGESLLTFEFDSVDNAQTVYDSQRAELLVIRHDTAGRVVQVTPRAPLDGLNVTYDRQGRWTQWSRGELTVSRVFDAKTGRLVERRLSPRLVYRYTYKNATKPTEVELPSGHEYQLDYDDVGGLKSVTTPSGARHIFHGITLIGRQRVTYRPPSTSGGASYTRDYDGAGRLVDERYPSDHRRVAYRYDGRGRIAAIFYDWIDVTLRYDEASVSETAVANVTVQRRAGDPFECSVSYNRESSLITAQHVRYAAGSQGLVDAAFRYSYGSNFWLTAMEVTIGERNLPTEANKFDPLTGNVIQQSPFVFERAHVQRHVTRDLNVEIVREFDARGRPTDVWYRFNNHVVFTVETKYDAIGRVHQWRRKVRSSDLKAFEYVYDVDGPLVEVLENGQSTWRYETDSDGNLIRVMLYARPRPISVNEGGAPTTVGDVSYSYDVDGFLVSRGDTESFDYDSVGRLTRAYRMSTRTGRYDVHYNYDGLGRLSVRRETTFSGGAKQATTTQYFYADLSAKWRITHVHHVTTATNGSSDETGTIVRYFYDARGKLYAMRRSAIGSDVDEMFYVGLDPFDSPIVVLNGVGSVVKQVTYDPLGACTSDTAPDLFNFLLFGYRGALADSTVRLVITVDGLAYDPAAGRWTSARYGRVLDLVDRIPKSPQLVGLLYRNDIRSWKYSPMIEVDQWLPLMGFNYGSLVPAVHFAGVIGPLSASILTPSPDVGAPATSPSMSVTSAFQCAFDRDMFQFSKLSLVTPSVVTDSGLLVDGSDVDSNDEKLGSSSSDGTSFSSATFSRPSAARGGVSTSPYVFGGGVVLQVDPSSGIVNVIALDSAHPTIALLAAILLNGSSAVFPRFAAPRGRDVQHFVRPSLDQAVDDLRQLNVRTEATVHGLNVSVHRVHEAPGGSSLRYVDVRVHGEQATIIVRYGTTLASERVRLLHHAWQRAVDAAWTVERELVQAGRVSANVWTRSQTEELVARGRVDGFTGQYIRDATDGAAAAAASFGFHDWIDGGRSSLADWSKNIRFVPAVR